MKIILQAFLLSSLLISCNQPSKPVAQKKIKQNNAFSALVEMPVEESNHFVQNQLRVLKTWYYTGSFGKRAEPDRIYGMNIYSLNHYYTNLSNHFNIDLKINEKNSNPDCYEGIFTLQIKSKSDSLIQIIKTIGGSCAYPFTDSRVSHVRSYETHFNEKKEMADGYYHGELVVGDFNFDSLTDIAIVTGYTMSGTPTYEFYFQKENHQFERNAYFSDVVQNLPQKWNPQKQTFLAWSHTGCCWAKFRYFKFDETGKCKLIYMKETGPEQE